MKFSDGWRYQHLPPTAVLGLTQTFVQVKVGPGQLRYVWVLDDLSPAGSQFSVIDGLIGVQQSPGLPPSISGQALFPSATGQLGPMCLDFKTGLVIVYTNNSAQLSGFVSFR